MVEDKVSEKSENMPLFNPFITRTEHIMEELHKTSERFKIDIHYIDFAIISYQTYTKLNSEADAEWEEVDTNDETIFNDEKLLLDEEFFIRQVYDIEIFAVTEQSPIDKLKINIVGNKDLTKIYLSIKVEQLLNITQIC